MATVPGDFVNDPDRPPTSDLGQGVMVTMVFDSGYDLAALSIDGLHRLKNIDADFTEAQIRYHILLDSNLPLSENDHLRSQIDTAVGPVLGGVNPSITDFVVRADGTIVDFGLNLDGISPIEFTRQYQTLRSGVIQMSIDVINAIEWVARRYTKREKTEQQADSRYAERSTVGTREDDKLPNGKTKPPLRVLPRTVASLGVLGRNDT